MSLNSTSLPLLRVRAHSDCTPSGSLPPTHCHTPLHPYTRPRSPPPRCSAQVRSLEADKRAATDAVPRTAHKRVKLASRVSELESRAAADGETRSRLGAEAVALASRIATVRAALDATAPGTVGSARAAAEAAYASVKAELQSVTDAMDAIYDKQGRGKRFKSVKERNAHLASLAQAAQEEKAAKLAAAAAADKEAAAAASKGSKAAAALAAARKEMGAQQAKESELASASESQATARTDADAARKSAWARQQELEATLRSARERASAAERAMHQATPPPVRSGLESVRTLMEHAAKAAAGGAGDAAAQGAGAASGAAAAGGKKGKGAQAAAAAAAPGAGALPVIPGIFGALIDLVKPTHARYNTAVDVAAATQLLNVVVDTDMTAKAVIDHLQATRGGRVTLVPLNRVSAPYNIQYPKSDDCRPLIQFLTCALSRRRGCWGRAGLAHTNPRRISIQSPHACLRDPAHSTAPPSPLRPSAPACRRQALRGRGAAGVRSRAAVPLPGSGRRLRQAGPGPHVHHAGCEFSVYHCV